MTLNLLVYFNDRLHIANLEIAPALAEDCKVKCQDRVELVSPS